MYKKYTVKFNPTVIGTRFTDVKDLALSRAQEGMLAVASIRDLVRPILDGHGIGGGQRGTYLAFALALWKHTNKQKDDVARLTANGLKSYFVTAYGLDPDILDEIIKTVCAFIFIY